MGDGREVEVGLPLSRLKQLIGNVFGRGGEDGGRFELTLVGAGSLSGIRKTIRWQGGGSDTLFVGGVA
jgi:hypothetical protein